ncbi:hypothetical protein C478_16697 [Natrinema thermotolerans DSM 11552]|nr:hypothetical protein C478_16697 [Natrinema thermotolerans DSM 11552]
MDRRKRAIVGSLWIGVAIVMATTLEIGVPTSASAVARLFVVAVALFLAAIYALDPWNVVSDPFRQG